MPSLAGATQRIRRAASDGRGRLSRLLDDVRFGSPADIAVVDARSGARRGDVEQYWSSHTVLADDFLCAKHSSDYLEWRFAEYPLFREYMSLSDAREGQVVLDYGCGPGNDVTGFLINTNAARVIGCDVSPKALGQARRRLMLHRVDPARVSLMLIDDSLPVVPLEDATVDHVHSGGVIHHTSFPDQILAELFRVLKPGCTANFMVYGYDSVYVHLFIAYEKMILDGRFEGMSLAEAFEAYADGEGCPIARLDTPQGFLETCRAAGFSGEYLGGYLSKGELDSIARHLDDALDSPKLGDESKSFLSALTFDSDGLPLHEGMHAGLSMCFRLHRPA